MLNRKKIILVLSMVLLVAIFSSMGFAENDIKPSVYVEEECVCYPVDSGFSAFHCCTHRYKYNNEGYLIADDILGCKFTDNYGDCPY